MEASPLKILLSVRSPWLWVRFVLVTNELLVEGSTGHCTSGFYSRLTRETKTRKCRPASTTLSLVLDSFIFGVAQRLPTPPNNIKPTGSVHIDSFFFQIGFHISLTAVSGALHPSSIAICTPNASRDDACIYFVHVQIRRCFATVLVTVEI